MSSSASLKELNALFLSLARNLPPDLTIRNLSILLAVYMDGEAYTVRALANHLDISKGAVSRAIDTLEKRGLLVRLPDPKDGRSITLGRTPRGIEDLRFISSLTSAE